MIRLIRYLLRPVGATAFGLLQRFATTVGVKDARSEMFLSLHINEDSVERGGRKWLLSII